MIIEFSVKNFFSFKDKTTFSMFAENISSLENNYVTVNGRKILKTSAIYGANASGKTNLFKVLNVVINMLKESNPLDINAALTIISFKLDEKMNNKPSEFQIKFIYESIRYVYGFSADKYQIYDEYLYYYPNGREAIIFDRTNISDYSYNIKDEKFLNEIALKTAPNKFFLSTATNWNYNKTKPAYDFLTNSIGVYFDISILKKEAFSKYIEEEKELRNFTLSFLNAADFNIEDYKVIKIEVPSDLLEKVPDEYKSEFSNKFVSYQVNFKHKGSNDYLDFELESMGTKMIFTFIPFIYDCIRWSFLKNLYIKKSQILTKLIEKVLLRKI